jgi:hypothetical protein
MQRLGKAVILLPIHTRMMVFVFDTTVSSLQRMPIVIIQQEINTNTLVNDQSQAVVEEIQVLPC